MPLSHHNVHMAIYTELNAFKFCAAG